MKEEDFRNVTRISGKKRLHKSRLIQPKDVGIKQVLVMRAGGVKRRGNQDQLEQ